MPNFATMRIHNCASDQWVKGSGKRSELIDASTGELIGISVQRSSLPQLWYSSSH